MLKLLLTRSFCFVILFGMSNLPVFDIKRVQLLLEPFALGMTTHIMPIKYEALTPDSFLLFFRYADQDGNNRYFVLLESDFQSSIEGARCTIEEWHSSKVIKFLPLREDTGLTPSEDAKGFQALINGVYFEMLAEVKQPTHEGNQADSVTIMPNDRIGDKIKDFSENAQKNIRKALTEVLRHRANPSASFFDSLNGRKKDTIVNDINMTDMAVTLYVQPDDGVELVYNYVNQIVGGRPRRSKGHNE